MHRNVEKRVFKYIYLINDALKQSSFQRVLGWLSDKSPIISMGFSGLRETGPVRCLKTPVKPC